jgi:glyoxylase I family protein
MTPGNSIFNGLHHASLLISDLDASRAFYAGMLGMEIDDRRPDLDFPGMWLTLGQQQIHLLLLDRTSAGTGNRHPGRDAHTAVAVTSLATLIARLDSAGITYTMSSSGRRALFCRDPDGNGLEFIEIQASE